MRLLLTILFIFTFNTSAEEYPQGVAFSGENKMTWWGFKIYDAKYYESNETNPKQLLELTYARDIKVEQLISSTRKEWKRLKLYDKKKSEDWLTELSKIWPSVTNGTTLSIYVFNGKTYFFENKKFKGMISDAELSENLIEIWLHPKSRIKGLKTK